MDHVILYRMKGGKGRFSNVQFVIRIDGDTSDIAVWPDFEAALAYADTNSLFQSGQADYQIVELNEL